jgi:hypothetical protein
MNWVGKRVGAKDHRGPWQPNSSYRTSTARTHMHIYLVPDIFLVHNFGSLVPDISLATMMYYNWSWGRTEDPFISEWAGYLGYQRERKLAKLLGKYIQARRALREWTFKIKHAKFARVHLRWGRLANFLLINAKFYPKTGLLQLIYEFAG